MMEKEIEKQIDRFIENEMLPAERESFCREMMVNPRLKEQVALRKLLVEAELVEAEKAARKAMERSTKPLQTKRVGGMIAVACMLVGVVLFIGNRPRYTTDEIFQTYFTEPVIELSRTGNGLDIADIQTNRKLVGFYQQKQHSQVAALYHQHWSNRDWNELPVVSLLYATVSLLHCNRAAEAIPLLSSSALLSSPYAEEAEWLLLLAYLQEDRLEEVDKIADKIKTGGGPYTHKAAEIIIKLKEKRGFSLLQKSE